MLFKFIWNFKYQLGIFCLVLFGFSLYQLFNANIYFDSERIINELEANNFDLKIVDDNNLIFLGVTFDDSLTYQDFRDINTFHDELKNSDYVNRLFSIINDKKIINMGLFPMVKKTMNLQTEDTYHQSLQYISKQANNFITQDTRNLLFLIEASPSLSNQETKDFINILYATKINEKSGAVSVAGRAPSELYFEKKVIREFIIITLISSILCFLFLFLITQNMRLVLLTVFSVIASIVVTLGISQTIFGGIELVMIITPAILFIVCISDIMHLTNKQKNKENDKWLFFNLRMGRVGKAVILTSLTTSMSFLTFLVNDILPIVRFGIITSIGVAFTLFIALVVYAISIDKNINKTTPIPLLKKLTDGILFWFEGLKNKVSFHLVTFVFVVFGVFAVFNVNIDNYLTDEINKKSEMYKQTAYFDQFFGGIKPITVMVEKTEFATSEKLSSVKDLLLSQGFVVDFTNTTFDGMAPKSMTNMLNQSDDQHFFVCRSGDEGSLATLEKLNLLEASFPLIQFSYSGAGYLFDLLGNDLTKRLIYGLFIAILSIGIVFFVMNKFDFNYFVIALIPNLVPIVLCLGVLYQLGFYFSLSNAFIFTIVFGLIVDDSIHVISSYTNHRKMGVDKDEALYLTVNNTGSAIIKTTFVVLICLLPLAFSEFKSVSQLSVITIISAIIAIFFDLIYLPMIIKKLTKS
jgi:predicted RND superfamily exporter protein